MTIKNQHFISKFLLKRGKTDKDKLCILFKKKIEIIDFDDNNKYFTKDFLYEFNELHDNNLEKKIGKIEQKYSKLTANIIHMVTTDYKTLNQINPNKNDMALIILFKELQRFRYEYYGELTKTEKIEALTKLNDYIDAYYNYTQMSKKDQNKKAKELQQFIDDINIKYKDNFDKGEYEIHKIIMSPEYFLIHAINTMYYFTIVPFPIDVFPISQLGGLKHTSKSSDNYFYIQPISPRIAFFIMPQYLVDTNYELFQDFYNLIHIYGKGIGFNELAVITNYIVIPENGIDIDLIQNFRIYNEGNTINMRVMNNDDFINYTLKNKKEYE